MRYQLLTLSVLMGLCFAPITAANAADGRAHYQIFYDACVVTQGKVALAKKHADAQGWKADKNIHGPEGSPVQAASWTIIKEKSLYSVFVSTSPEVLLLDKNVHPDLAGVPFGICWVSATQAVDTIAADNLKLLLNSPGCAVKLRPGAPKSTMFVHWPMRGPGYAISYGFARYTTKDIEGTFERDVLGRTFAATAEPLGHTFVRTACDATHAVLAPTLF
jgi:hypothetical protein